MQKLKELFHTAKYDFFTCGEKFNVINKSLRLKNNADIIIEDNVESQIIGFDTLIGKLSDNLPNTEIQIQLENNIVDALLYRISDNDEGVNYFIVMLKQKFVNTNKEINSINYNFISSTDFDYADNILELVKKLNKKIIYKNNAINNEKNKTNIIEYIEEIAKLCYSTKKNNSQLNIYTSLVNQEEEITLKSVNINEFLRNCILEIKSLSSIDNEEIVDNDSSEYYDEADEELENHETDFNKLLQEDDKVYNQIFSKNDLYYDDNYSLDENNEDSSEKYKFIYGVRNKHLYADVNEYYLKIVMCEIISNACKFIENGNTITIILDNNDTDVLISVMNNGCGLHESIINNAFEPFVKYYSKGFKDNLKGCGLGLSIANKIIKIFGGGISINRDDVNTIATISIPIGKKVYVKNVLNEFSKPQREFSDIPYDKLAFCNIFGNYLL